MMLITLLRLRRAAIRCQHDAARRGAMRCAWRDVAVSARACARGACDARSVRVMRAHARFATRHDIMR